MNALKTINTKARSLMRTNKRLSWRQAIKKASAWYNGKGKKAKQPATKKKSSSVMSRKKSTRVRGSVVSHLSDAKKLLQSQIGDLEAKRFAATTKKVKRFYASQIREKKRLYNKLK